MIERPISLVLIEAVLIGLLTLAIYTGVSKVVKDTRALILTGALVHLFFEYSPMGNLNERYCKISHSKWPTSYTSPISLSLSSKK